jgi:hypothetical protein
MPKDEPNQPLDLKTAIILAAIFSVLVIFKLVTNKFIWGDSWESEMIYGIIGFGLMTVVIFFYYFKSRKK